MAKKVLNQSAYRISNFVDVLKCNGHKSHKLAAYAFELEESIKQRKPVLCISPCPFFPAVTSYIFPVKQDDALFIIVKI